MKRRLSSRDLTARRVYRPLKPSVGEKRRTAMSCFSNSSATIAPRELSPKPTRRKLTPLLKTFTPGRERSSEENRSSSARRIGRQLARYSVSESARFAMASAKEERGQAGSSALTTTMMFGTSVPMRLSPSLLSSMNDLSMTKIAVEIPGPVLQLLPLAERRRPGC